MRHNIFPLVSVLQFLVVLNIDSKRMFLIYVCSLLAANQHRYPYEVKHIIYLLTLIASGITEIYIITKNVVLT